MSDNRPPRYEEDGKVIYRASSLGMCDKMFVALSMGYEPKAHPAWFQEILDEGTANEAIIRGMYEDEVGAAVEDISMQVEMEILDGIWIRGSIDGRSYQLGKQSTLNEFKKIRDSGWQRYLSSGVEFQANYPMQTSFYMFALGESEGFDWNPMAFTGGHYVQDDKTGEWSVTEVHTHDYMDPPVPLLAIKKRIAKLERLCKETEAIGDISCNITMFPCPMYYLHDDDQDEPPTRPGDDILAPLLDEWDKVEARRKALVPELTALDKDSKRLKEGVQAWLQASGQDSGDVCTTEIGGVEYGLKYLTSPRKGYVVPDGEQTRVTIKVTKRDGEKVANAPKKSTRRTKKDAPGNGEGVEGQAEPPAESPGVKKTLAPRPGAV